MVRTWNRSVGEVGNRIPRALWSASLSGLVRSGSQGPLALSGKVVTLALALIAQSLHCLQFLDVYCASKIDHLGFPLFTDLSGLCLLTTLGILH